MAGDLGDKSQLAMALSARAVCSSFTSAWNGAENDRDGWGGTVHGPGQGQGSGVLLHTMSHCALANLCLPLRLVGVLEFRIHHPGLWSLQDIVLQNPCCIWGRELRQGLKVGLELAM